VNDDEKLAADEARKLSKHEEIKDELREQAHADIARQAEATRPTDRETAAVATELKRHAVREVADTEGEIARARRVNRLTQIVDYVFFLIYGIITLEIVLEALGARENAGFKQFVDTLAAPLLAPFEGLMADPGAGNYRFMLSYVFALIAYFLLHLAVKKLLRLFVRERA
jgi:hypothetical protein